MSKVIITEDGEKINLEEHNNKQPMDFYATKFDQSKTGVPMGAYNITVEQRFRHTNVWGALPQSWREHGAYGPWKGRHR